METPPSSPNTDILIIGAGPSGLALGYELKQLGLSFELLERGDTVGESWRRMPNHWKLVSPWEASRLPGKSLRPWSHHREVTRQEFLDYLKDYTRTHSLPVRTNITVRSVRHDPNAGFRIETSAGPLSCGRLVSATGYFQNPCVPAVFRFTPVADNESPNILLLHAAEFESAERLAQRLGRNNPSVLIVGKRLSAGQLLLELAAAGFKVAVSHRSPIQFGSGPLGWWIFFRIHPWIERWLLRLRGTAARGFDVRMPGGTARGLIQSGSVRLFPAIQRWDGRQIYFENNETFQPDAVILATGFRPALDYLRDLGLSLDPDTGLPRTSNMQSVEVPGLYFLGLDHLRNFQSRFLRGLRHDAAILARQLATE